MLDTQCAKFGSCDAPLCPLRASWLASGVWAPGEAMCTRHFTDGTPRWLKAQRRLAKRLAGVLCVGLFSVRMLEAIGKVTPATRGLSPDVADWLAAEATWCSGRKPLGPRGAPTDAQLAARAAFGDRRRKELLQTRDNTSGAAHDSCAVAECSLDTDSRRTILGAPGRLHHGTGDAVLPGDA
jgi:hypothetical protein